MLRQSKTAFEHNGVQITFRTGAMLRVNKTYLGTAVPKWGFRTGAMLRQSKTGGLDDSGRQVFRTDDVHKRVIPSQTAVWSFRVFIRMRYR